MWNSSYNSPDKSANDLYSTVTVTLGNIKELLSHDYDGIWKIGVVLSWYHVYCNSNI